MENLYRVQYMKGYPEAQSTCQRCMEAPLPLSRCIDSFAEGGGVVLQLLLCLLLPPRKGNDKLI